MAITLELALGNDSVVYNNMVASMPEGGENQTTGLIVPTHTPNRPLSFTLKGVTKDLPYLLTITCEHYSPPQPNVAFVPNGTEYSLSVALSYGVHTFTIQGGDGSINRFYVTATHYAALFRAEANEISENIEVPINTTLAQINSAVAFYLTLPLTSDYSHYIPSGLETLGLLANRYLGKNLTNRPGTEASTEELLTAFTASTPVLNPMLNLGAPEFPLFKGAEEFSGWEAHCWFPNREVERWAAFSLFINNLPQLYTLLDVKEGRVILRDGEDVKTHYFDFDSETPNTVIEGNTGDECFLNLFRLEVSISAEIYIAFCQAAYQFDTQILDLETPDADPLGVTNWNTFTLSGRFEQQYDIAYLIHQWFYESPVSGVVDGSNRFYELTEAPNSRKAVKLFLDGLLLRFNVDYRISSDGDFRSGFFSLAGADPIYIDINVGDPRPFLAPVFGTFEVLGSLDLQYLITAADQNLTNLKFIISNPPASSGDPQEARLHYISPALPSGSYGGANQYGTESLTAGSTSYSITFPTPAASISYQLVVQLGEDPLPGGGPSAVSQFFWLPRGRSLSSQLVEFSDVVTSNDAKLHWWLIEADNVALERGTLLLVDGQMDATIPFTAGPYTDPVTILLQLWTTSLVGDAEQTFVSFHSLTSLDFVAQLSAPVVGSTYRLDYLVFPAQAGNLIEIFTAPAVDQLVEAHYDTEWTYWESAAPLEIPDGVRSSFTLPTECPYPEALYLVLDGRLLTQGNENQYMVDNATTVRLTFVPTVGQTLWAVYPIANPLTQELPGSVWSQKFLTRLQPTSGESALGKIYNQSVITDGDSVSFKDVTFTATAPAQGAIANPVKITPSDSVTFVGLGKTFTGVLYTLYVPQTFKGVLPPANFDVGTETVTMASHGFLTNSGVYFESTGTLPAPLTSGVRYYVVSVALNTFQLAATPSGAVIDLTTAGSGSISVYTGALLTEFKAGLSRDSDGAALAERINAVLSDLYQATYSQGVTTLVARALTGTSANQVLTVSGSSLFVSSITGDSPTALDEIQALAFSTVPDAGKFSLSFNGFSTADLPYNVTATAVEAALNNLPTPTNVTVTGSTTLGFTVTFAVLDGAQDQPLLTVKGPTLTFLPADVNTVTDTVTLLAHGLVERQSVGFFSTSGLPAPLTTATYYIHVIDVNTVQILTAPDSGIVNLTTAGTGVHTVTSNSLATSGVASTVTVTETQKGYGNHFPGGVSQTDDSAALAASISANPIIANNYTVLTAAGETTVIAKTVGVENNATFTFVGMSMSADSIDGGQNPLVDPPFLAYKPFYNHEAPVVSLDGLSTRLYDSYSGNAVKFDTKPVALQEPYAVSQVFPIDSHALDSMVANQPCNYPKGLFTQGLNTQLTEVDIDVEQEGLLVISVDNLPIQEEPIGVVDGVNTIFDLTYESCAGQNSLMLWINGIFQPPTTYVYSVTMGHGCVTFSTAPAVVQKLWAWYLPVGDACAEEHVETLVGAVDSVNQNYAITSGPVANAPALVLFLEGLINLQGTDYTVNPGNTTLTFLGALAPATGESLWVHFNEGNIGTEQWRQVFLGVADGVTTVYTIPFVVSTELPTSQDSVILALDGLVQREGVDFIVNTGMDGFPTGVLTFPGGAPESGRRVEVYFIRR